VLLFHVISSGQETKVRNAYLETSALDAISKLGLATSEVSRRFHDSGFEPCIGLLTINECAQAILGGNVQEALLLFRCIRDLKPRLLADPASLYKAETRFLRERVPVDPFATPSERDYVFSEVEKLAEGWINSRFYDLAQKRQQVTNQEWPRTMEKYLEEIKNIRKISLSDAPRFGTFKDLKNYFWIDVVRFILAVPELTLSLEEAKSVAAEYEHFPAIVGTVCFWWYAFFVCLSNGCVPGADKANDWRHTIEAAHCESFITNDQQLYRQVTQLQPLLGPMMVNELFPTLE
jgi:hypothetical protein